MDFETARFNMIEQQIRPWNVLDQTILDLLKTVKREHFVCESLQNVAFADCDLPIRIADKNTGEYMFSPKLEARFLQELHIQPADKVLEIGTGTGYMAALLTCLAAEVNTIEIQPEIAALARHNLQKNGIDLVKVIDGCGFERAPSLGQFDVIVLSGSTELLPETLLKHLSPGGRFLGIAGKEAPLQATLVKKSHTGNLSTTPLFETWAKPLANGPKAPVFEF
ncbi:MAG: protein-L-isoaspartate O-methyltransferase [Limnobacter sp.]|nr:protein-L-isoaspartate O-methyltransferase [Limnobacter sp.]